MQALPNLTFPCTVLPGAFLFRSSLSLKCKGRSVSRRQLSPWQVTCLPSTAWCKLPAASPTCRACCKLTAAAPTCRAKLTCDQLQGGSCPRKQTTLPSENDPKAFCLSTLCDFKRFLAVNGSAVPGHQARGERTLQGGVRQAKPRLFFSQDL